MKEQLMVAVGILIGLLACIDSYREFKRAKPAFKIVGAFIVIFCHLVLVNGLYHAYQLLIKV